MRQDEGKPGDDAAAAVPAEPPLVVYDGAALFAGRSEIGIRHDGALYRLRITRQGKLILNK